MQPARLPQGKRRRKQNHSRQPPAILLRPALAQNKKRGPATLCRNNFKQIFGGKKMSEKDSIVILEGKVKRLQERITNLEMQLIINKQRARK